MSSHYSRNPVIITGAGGMLGSALVRYFSQHSMEFKAYTHAELDITCGSCIEKLIPEDSVVINAAGINPHGRYEPHAMAAVHSMGPHMLAARCAKLIQVSTDCVFSGEYPKQRLALHFGGYPYVESSIPEPGDWYGYSKLAGEVTYGDHLTVRCSFVGLQGGLLNWLYTLPENAVVDGWDSAQWTGMHVDELAQELWHLCFQEGRTGILHLVGSTWTKYELLLAAAALLRRDITVKSVVEPHVYRQLATETDFKLALSHTPSSMFRAISEEFECCMSDREEVVT